MAKDTETTGLEPLLCANVYALHHAFGRFYQAAFADTGFTYPKFLILKVLSERGAMSLGGLAEAIGVEANSLSPIVKKLAHFGLIARERDPDDERRIVLTILPFGTDILKDAIGTIEAGWDELGLDEEAICSALTVLGDVRDKLDAATPPKMQKRNPPST